MQSSLFPLSPRTVLESWQDEIFGLQVQAQYVLHCPLPDSGDESGIYYVTLKSKEPIGRLYRFDGGWCIDSDYYSALDRDVPFDDADDAETALVLAYIASRKGVVRQ